MRKTIALHKEGSNKHSNDDKVTEGIIQNIVDNHSDDDDDDDDIDCHDDDDDNDHHHHHIAIFIIIIIIICITSIVTINHLYAINSVYIIIISHFQ